MARGACPCSTGLACRIRPRRKSYPARSGFLALREARRPASPGRRKDRLVSPRRGVFLFRRPVRIALLRGSYTRIPTRFQRS